MNELLKGLETWFLDRPAWLQDCARRIIELGGLSSFDWVELTELCKAEAGILSAQTKPRGIPPGSLDKKEEWASLRLNSISNLSGINALSPRNPLVLGEGAMTIIYGQNGSGKSGYVRLLKHASGSRNPGKLLPNVFDDPQAENIQQGKFNITDDHGNRDLEWKSESGGLKELSNVELYDSDCANVYVNEENVVSYEPWLLSFFSQLINVCDGVGKSIKNELDALVSQKPIMPSEYRDTKAGKWYTNLDSNIEDTDIDSRCFWSPQMEESKEHLRSVMSDTNPAERAQELRTIIKNAQNLQKLLDDVITNYSDAKCISFLQAKASALQKRQIADEVANKIFSGALLDGIGKETWKSLWESARKYSDEVAYPHVKFPNTTKGSRCVLCHQLIDKDIATRLTSFEDFVKGQHEREAMEAGREVEILFQRFKEIPTKEEISLYLDSSKIMNEEDRIPILRAVKSLKERRRLLLEANSPHEIVPNNLDISGDFLLQYIQTLEQTASAFEQVNSDKGNDSAEEVRELEAQYWLHTHKSAIISEVELLRLKHGYKEALRLVNTAALSSKKSSLADELITQEYIQRFYSELKMLGGSKINVELLKSRTTKGQVFHQIRLKDCPEKVRTGDVLSEGELRIVSLAAFLADVQGRPNHGPFVFDDPISSLDQDFEEAAVHRLVDLCETRQVIVFTHRLSMVALLEAALKKRKYKYHIVCLHREIWGAGEPGGTPIWIKKPENALKDMLNARIPQSRKVLEAEGTVAYESLARGICADFRILLERIIEIDLLWDVVQRFRREIQTVGKINKLANITEEDCRLIDSFMTKYSRDMHSQAHEVAVKMPSPEEIENDLRELTSWLDEYKKR